MKGISIFATTILLSTIALGEAPESTNTPPRTKPPFATNSSSFKSRITVQEMLETGPTQLKMHSLVLIAQGEVLEVNDSFLPGFKVCSEERSDPIRSITAQLVGEHLVAEKPDPNPEAIALLVKLARDEAFEVRHAAVYYGLSRIKNKSDEIIELMIDMAAKNRLPSLYNQIVQALESERDRVIPMLDWKLETGDNIAIYEIYKDFTGKQPDNADKYLDMPSSRPHLLVFKGEGSDPEKMKAELTSALKAAGIENPSLAISGKDENHVLLLKTYITRDYLTVKENFSGQGRFKITQDMWLTPQLEIQINKIMQNK